MDSAELQHRFDYHPPRDQITIDAHQQVRQMCSNLATALNGLLREGREKSTAITRLEETMMWANASIARVGVRILNEEERVRTDGH